MPPSSPRRSPLLAVLVAMVAAFALLAGAPGATAAPAGDAAGLPVSAPLDDAGYWALADRLARRLGSGWSEDDGFYRAGGGGVEPGVNGQLLLLHAVAAAHGHVGPARDDARARSIAGALLRTAPFVTRWAPSGSQRHLPGWVNSMDSTVKAEQHLVYDSDIVDGLAAAYAARGALALPEDTVRRIRSAVAKVSASSFYRWPAIRQNQVNWYATMYGARATVLGDRSQLRRDLGLQMGRFVSGIPGRRGQAGNLGRGARFHYAPQQPLDSPRNVDSSEYANLTFSATRYLDAARSAGMPIPASVRSAWAAWGRRLLAGSWTHGGYLNWDTGLGFARWHQAKKLGLAQLGLLGLADSAALGLDDRWRRWAKWIFDRGLIFYDRQIDRSDGRVPKPLFFGVHARPQGLSSARLAAARMAANAARAIDAGLGAAAAERPPALYSYDPDTGRLAVTTPAYNTAIVAVNGGAFPYGGLDLARLYDGDQEVAAGIGGRPPASFGLQIRDGAGRRRLATQVGRRHVTRRTPLVLTEAPAGVRARANSTAGQVYAGPFSDLRATGLTSQGGLAARSSYRFTATAIEGRWSVRRHGARGALRAEALFPSTGSSARIVAVLRDGGRVEVGGAGLALAEIDHLEVRSSRSGYVVRPLTRPPGGWVRAVRPAAQSSAPNPGPTLAVRIGPTGFSRAAFSARITVGL
jgi:hypothetical protein